MTNDHRREELSAAALEDLFAELKTAAPPVPEPLLARVLADAAAHQPAAGSLGRTATAPAGRAGWSGVFGGLFGGLFGGGASLAGLALAAAAGVWIGFAQPFDLGFGLQAATLDTFDLFPAELDQMSEVLAADLLADD